MKFTLGDRLDLLDGNGSVFGAKKGVKKTFDFWSSRDRRRTTGRCRRNSAAL
jgi:hypothetical protein